MPDYAFQGSLYRNEREMLDTIAHEWLTAGGLNTDADLGRILSEYTDAEMAAECIKGWDLNVDEDYRPGAYVLGDGEEEVEPEDNSHMGRNNYSEGDLTNAFARLREQIKQAPPDEEAA